jgi:hypothetical protein
MTHISTARLWLVGRKPAGIPELLCGLPFDDAVEVVPLDAEPTAGTCPECLAARQAATAGPPPRGVGGYRN